MQQLLGDRPGLTGTSFLQELFLQRLPHNVRMVLASTPDTTSLEKFTELADKIMEVATPPIAAIDVPVPNPPESATKLAKEVEGLRADISRLEKMFQKLALVCPPAIHLVAHPQLLKTPSAGITGGENAKKCHSPCAWPTNEQAGH